MTREWSLAFGDDHGVEGSLHLTVADGPAPSATFEASLALPDTGYVLVRDDDLASPRGSLLQVRGDGLWAELVCETPGEHWSIGLEAFGLRFADEAEARVTDRGERVAIGFDLEWEAPGTVFGEILLGARRLAFDGRGTFSGPA